MYFLFPSEILNPTHFWETLVQYKNVTLQNPATKAYSGFDFELFFLFVPFWKELHGNQVGEQFWKNSEVRVVMNSKLLRDSSIQMKMFL